MVKTILFLSLLTTGSIFGCSQSSSSPSDTAVPSTAQISRSPSPYQTTDPFCTVEFPQNWQSVFARGKIPLPEQDPFVAIATAADGSKVFGSYYSIQWSGVIAATPDGTITHISQFADPNVDQVTGAAFDGRWLVWSEIHSLQGFSDWDNRAWDSTTGEVFSVNSAPPADRDAVGPFVLPIIWRGFAAWLQANGSGASEVHLYSLSDRVDRVLAVGKVSTPISFLESNLIWAEADGSGSSGHLVMASVPSGEPANLPAALADVHNLGTSLVATDGLVAWDDGRSLWIWRPGDGQPYKVFEAPLGNYVEFVGITGSLVTWGSGDQWAADLRSRSATKITTRGWSYANGDSLLVTEPTGPKAGIAPLSQTEVLNARDLPPLPTCAP